MPWPLCFCNLHESFWPKWTKGKVSTLSKFYNWQWQMAVLFAPHSHDSKDTAASATRHRDHQDAQHEKPTALKRSVDRGFGCIPKYVDVEHVWPVGGIWNSEMNTKWQNAYKIRKVEGPSTASSLAPDLFHIDSRNLRKKAFWDQRSNPFLQDRQSYIMCVCVCVCCCCFIVLAVYQSTDAQKQQLCIFSLESHVVLLILIWTILPSEISIRFTELLFVLFKLSVIVPSFHVSPPHPASDRSCKPVKMAQASGTGTT